MKVTKNNVFSKGQGGANFEFRVQSAFLIIMLIKGKVPCLPKGDISLIRFQANTQEYLFQTDDLYVELLSSENRKYQLLAQIKHNLTFSEKDESFLQVIKAAWEDFNSQNFDQKLDKIAIIKGNLSNKEYNHLLPILDWAKYKATSSDFFSEINALKSKQFYLEVFERSLEKVNDGKKISSETLWSFFKCFNIISYDFVYEESKDLVHLLNLIDLSKPDNSSCTSKQIWDKVFELVAKADSRGASFTLDNIPLEIKQSFNSTGEIKLFVHHKHSPPLSFDYFILNDRLTKSFTENWCKFKVVIENASSSLVVFDSISIKTLRYRVIPSRVLRLNSVKGRFTPENFTFNPSQIQGEEVRIFQEEELFKIGSRQEEVIVIELEKDVAPGYYELVLVFKGHYGEKIVELKSKVLPVVVSSKSDDRLTLETMKFFESPIKSILDLEDKKWRKLKQEDKKNKYLLYLGQTINERPSDIPFGSEWEIKGLKKRNIQEEGFDLNPKDKPKVFASLGIPIEEPLFDLSIEEKSLIEIHKKTSNFLE